MAPISAQRILDLWPELTPEKQAELVATAERLAAPDRLRPLTERDAIAQSRADFAAGRVLDEADYEAEMRRFLAGLPTLQSLEVKGLRPMFQNLV